MFSTHPLFNSLRDKPVSIKRKKKIFSHTIQYIKRRGVTDFPLLFSQTFKAAPPYLEAVWQVGKGHALESSLHLHQPQHVRHLCCSQLGHSPSTAALRDGARGAAPAQGPSWLRPGLSGQSWSSELRRQHTAALLRLRERGLASSQDLARPNHLTT